MPDETTRKAASTSNSQLANLREQYERDQLASARRLREAENEISRLWGRIEELRLELAEARRQARGT